MRELKYRNEEALGKRKREEKIENKEGTKKGKQNPELVAKRKMSTEEMM